MVKLGATYRDKITGFQGVATGYVQYITGCNQVLIAPMAKGGGCEMKTPEWLDEQRLDVMPGEPVIVLDNGASPGFDRSAPRR